MKKISPFLAEEILGNFAKEKRIPNLLIGIYSLIINAIKKNKVIFSNDYEDAVAELIAWADDNDLQEFSEIASEHFIGSFSKEDWYSYIKETKFRFIDSLDKKLREKIKFAKK